MDRRLRLRLVMHPLHSVPSQTSRLTTVLWPRVRDLTLYCYHLWFTACASYAGWLDYPAYHLRKFLEFGPEDLCVYDLSIPDRMR